jgi:DsbC/DsbD-like thiol-disulfide interchange protein
LQERPDRRTSALSPIRDFHAPFRLSRVRRMIRALLLALALAAPVEAGTYGAVPPAEVATVEVLAGWRDGDTHVAALRIRLAPGWKTYWRAPGDAGIPPVFTWTGSQNLASVGMTWPVPQVFHLNGLRSIGYSGEVILPLRLTAGQHGTPIHLAGTIEIGVCQDVCMPFSLSLVADLPAGGAPDPVIRAALANRATTAREAGVTALACTVEPIADGLRLTATLRMPPRGSGEEVVVFETGTPGVWVSEATSRRSGATLTASADLVPPDARPFPLDRSQLRLTVLDAGRAVDILGCPAG